MNLCKKITVVGMCFCFLFLSFRANAMEGKELFRMCFSDDSARNATCGGFILGAHKGIFYGAVLTSEDVSTTQILRKLKFCPPNDSTFDHSIDVVINFMAENPEKVFDQSALFIIHDAFVDAYPCK